MDKPPQERTIDDIKDLLDLTRVRALLVGANEQHNKFFEPLSTEVCMELCKVMRFESFPANAVVFRKGDLGSKFYIVLQGAVNVIIPDDAVRSRVTLIDK
jgi:signal-transduction protein with cAMP-binding, CBS, and nucleotidyltransferase domain